MSTTFRRTKSGLFVPPSGGGGYAATVLAEPTLLGYWRAGESSGMVATDSGPGGRNGAYGGSITLGATGLITGDSDTAVLYDGSSAFMHIPSTGLMPTAAIAADMIVKPVSVGAQAVLFTHANSAAGFGTDWVFFFYHDSSGKLGCYILSGSSSAFAQSSGAVLSNGTKAHVGFTYDGAHLDVVVNGSSVATASFSGALNTAGPQDLMVGASLSGSNTPNGNYFNGTIDEVALYSSLSIAEMAAHAALI